MLEIKDGKLIGTCEIPADIASMTAILCFGGIDFSQYTTREIAEMTGYTQMQVLNARNNGIKKGYTQWVNHGKKVSHNRSKNKPIVVEDEDNIFTKRLKQMYLTRHESMKDFADAIGVPVSTAWNWFRQGTVPKTPNMRKIADHYHTTIEYLSGQTNRPMRRY